MLLLHIEYIYAYIGGFFLSYGKNSAWEVYFWQPLLWYRLQRQSLGTKGSTQRWRAAGKGSPDARLKTGSWWATSSSSVHGALWTSPGSSTRWRRLCSRAARPGAEWGPWPSSGGRTTFQSPTTRIRSTRFCPTPMRRSSASRAWIILVASISARPAAANRAQAEEVQPPGDPKDAAGGASICLQAEGQAQQEPAASGQPAGRGHGAPGAESPRPRPAPSANQEPEGNPHRTIQHLSLMNSALLWWCCWNPILERFFLFHFSSRFMAAFFIQSSSLYENKNRIITIIIIKKEQPFSDRRASYRICPSEKPQ